MVKRFSVSVSDELGERFEPFKERISPSNIFQKALQNVVEREERLTADVDDEDMDNIIERLREQKNEINKDYYALGREHGNKISKELSYHGLISMLQYIERDYDKWSEIDMHYEDDEELSGAIYTMFLQLDNWLYVDFPRLRHVENNHISSEATNYLNGISDSIKIFWDKVKDRI